MGVIWYHHRTLGTDCFSLGIVTFLVIPRNLRLEESLTTQTEARSWLSTSLKSWSREFRFQRGKRLQWLALCVEVLLVKGWYFKFGTLCQGHIDDFFLVQVVVYGADHRDDTLCTVQFQLSRGAQSLT